LDALMKIQDGWPSDTMLYWSAQANLNLWTALDDDASKSDRRYYKLLKNIYFLRNARMPRLMPRA
jgi:hypothetical protein